MDDVGWWLYALLVMFIGLGSYFAASEISLASVNQARIRIRADKGDKKAQKTLYILEHFDDALTTILIGNNITHIFAASIATLLATKLWGSGAVLYTTIVMTLVIFLVSEMLPKTLAKAYCERVSVAISPSLYRLMFLFRPLSFGLTAVGQFFTRVLLGEQQQTVTEEEFYEIIESLKDEDAMEDEKGAWVQTALNFGDKTVEGILTVRTDMVAIDIADSLDDIFETVKSSKHSRLPVYHDTVDNIIGVLQIRKYLRACYQQQQRIAIDDFIDPPFFVHEGAYIDELLSEMSRKKVNLAIATNNFGGVVGIVTVEDILEELVGEIWDEDDVAVEYYKPAGDMAFEVDASMLVEDVFELLEYDDYDMDDIAHMKISAWAYEELGKIPSEGDAFDYKELHVSVRTMDNRRIRTLLVVRNIPAAETTESEEADTP
ncbi:MAG: HlyC/CorC family transporter [Clostridiales bacterium]|nr:HlyC/CorC family transporter [Clostridiales bacterium]